MKYALYWNVIGYNPTDDNFTGEGEYSHHLPVVFETERQHRFTRESSKLEFVEDSPDDMDYFTHTVSYSNPPLDKCREMARQDLLKSPHKEMISFNIGVGKIDEDGRGMVYYSFPVTHIHEQKVEVFNDLEDLLVFLYRRGYQLDMTNPITDENEQDWTIYYARGSTAVKY